MPDDQAIRKEMSQAKPDLHACRKNHNRRRGKMFRRTHGSGVAGVFVFLTIFAVPSVGQEERGDRALATESLPVEPVPVQSPVTQKAHVDVLINKINNELKTSRRKLLMKDFIRTHTGIATLIGELRKVCPDDPHVAKFLPERWHSLKFLAGFPSTNAKGTVHRMRELNAEIDEVLKTTTNSELKCDATFWQTVFKLDEPIDGPAAVSLAEEFVSEWPEDNRSAEILHIAMTKLDSAWYARMAVITLLVVISTLTVSTSFRPKTRTQKWLRLGIIVGLLGTATFVVLIAALPIYPVLRKIEAATSGIIPLRVIVAMNHMFGPNLISLFCAYRFWLVVVIAGATTLSWVASRQRSEATIFERFTKVRRLILGFSLSAALCFAVDAYLISGQSAEVMRRVAQDYPNSFRGRLAQGQIRKRERIGEPFELEFIDEISGREVSMKTLRGKVVVVVFWATWCGPCVYEFPELKRLYAKYHEQGVEFIGVSHDAPESDGGMEELKSFVKKEQIPWPQYYQGHDNHAVRTGSAVNDFSEYWGIDGIPTIFLIDPSGNLYSTEARGRLDALIPLLLEQRGNRMIDSDVGQAMSDDQSL
ncbi:MAG: TlpA disulfide reductase family protein [Planctomycetaceae bacterium]